MHHYLSHFHYHHYHWNTFTSTIFIHKFEFLFCSTILFRKEENKLEKMEEWPKAQQMCRFYLGGSYINTKFCFYKSPVTFWLEVKGVSLIKSDWKRKWKVFPYVIGRYTPIKVYLWFKVVGVSMFLCSISKSHTFLLNCHWCTNRKWKRKWRNNEWSSGRCLKRLKNWAIEKI